MLDAMYRHIVYISRNKAN